jgi:hypothetical protein
MARILPDGWKALHLSGGARREIETLAQLEAALPDDYTVYHSVHWTRLRQGFSVFGEMDFVVVSPSGRVAAIEQKAGALEETDDGLTKTYSGKSKNVAVQLGRAIAGLRNRLDGAFGPGNYRVEELLYCPDYTVRYAAVAGVNPSRIVDASRRDVLSSVIEQILPAHEDPLPCNSRIHSFFAGELSLMPDAGAAIGEASKLVTQLSDGLATWARRIQFNPFRLRVIGTAGSGKTQLAIGVLHDAVAAGHRALYVCYNRPLADHVRAIAPRESHIMTFHQLCEAVTIEAGTVVDFSDSSAFATLEQTFSTLPPSDRFKFDVVIVDEGQDFLQAWVEPLERLLQPDGRWWWLEDPMQNLYQRQEIALPDWVEVRATSNYRSPRDIVRFIGQLSGKPLNIEAASPLDSSNVELVSYPGGSAVQATKQALADALALGYRPADIAVLTFQGREKSFLANLDQLGRHRLRSFTGEYDEAGVPLYRAGDVLLETVYRFKGQCAPCVILTEVDFPAFDEGALRRLFVGATRATMKLIVVMSERAAEILLERCA